MHSHEFFYARIPVAVKTFVNRWPSSRSHARSRSESGATDPARYADRARGLRAARREAEPLAAGAAPGRAPRGQEAAPP